MMRCRPRSSKPSRRDFAGGFQGEAFSVVVGVEHEADLALAVFGAEVFEVEVADELSGFGEFHGYREELALLRECRAVDALRQSGSGFRAAARSPVQVADDVRAGLERVQGIEIVVPERAEEQAFGADRIVRPEHSPSLATSRRRCDG